MVKCVTSCCHYCRPCHSPLTGCFSCHSDIWPHSGGMQNPPNNLVCSLHVAPFPQSSYMTWALFTSAMLHAWAFSSQKLWFRNRWLIIWMQVCFSFYKDQWSAFQHDNTRFMVLFLSLPINALFCTQKQAEKEKCKMVQKPWLCLLAHVSLLLPGMSSPALVPVPKLPLDFSFFQFCCLFCLLNIQTVDIRHLLHHPDILWTSHIYSIILTDYIFLSSSRC